jgi:hypothetical protein
VLSLPIHLAAMYPSINNPVISPLPAAPESNVVVVAPDPGGTRVRIGRQPHPGSAGAPAVPTVSPWPGWLTALLGTLIPASHHSPASYRRHDDRPVSAWNE